MGVPEPSYRIYLRILGYIATITMHIANSVTMAMSFHGEVMKNDFVRHFSEMQLYFFTCWTFAFQVMYATLALLCDILTLKNSTNKNYKVPNGLRILRELMFTIFVWPASILTFSMFWTIFYIDRSLLFPVDIDLVVSRLSNHIMHTLIAPVAMWEAVLKPRREPRTHGWRMTAVWAVEVIYIATMFLVYAFKGVWIYPIFGMIYGTIYQPLFFLMVATLLFIIYHVQWHVYALIWGKDLKKNI